MCKLLVLRPPGYQETTTEVAEWFESCESRIVSGLSRKLDLLEKPMQ